jgi:hypothetical protein
MIAITSNLDKVIGQLTGLQAEVPKAVERALLPAKWIDRARETAEKTLFVLARHDEFDYVREFARAVTAMTFLGAGLSLRLPSPRPELRQVLAEAQAAATITPGHTPDLELFQETVQEFENLILQWVQTPESEGGKRRDARDEGKRDEDIAHLISYILLSPQVGETGMAARAALMPHVTAFLQTREKERVGMTPERIDTWLRTVMVAWRSMVQAEITGRIRAELKAKKFP